MSRKIIIWGAILSAVGFFGWVVSVVFSVLTGGAFRTAANVFGIIAVASLPSAIIIWVLSKIFKR